MKKYAKHIANEVKLLEYVCNAIIALFDNSDEEEVYILIEETDNDAEIPEESTNLIHIAEMTAVTTDEGSDKVQETLTAEEKPTSLSHDVEVTTNEELAEEKETPEALPTTSRRNSKKKTRASKKTADTPKSQTEEVFTRSGRLVKRVQE